MKYLKDAGKLILLLLICIPVLTFVWPLFCMPDYSLNLLKITLPEKTFKEWLIYMLLLKHKQFMFFILLFVFYFFYALHNIEHFRDRNYIIRIYLIPLIISLGIYAFENFYFINFESKINKKAEKIIALAGKKLHTDRKLILLKKEKQNLWILKDKQNLIYDNGKIKKSEEFKNIFVCKEIKQFLKPVNEISTFLFVVFIAIPVALIFNCRWKTASVVIAFFMLILIPISYEYLRYIAFYILNKIPVRLNLKFTSFSDIVFCIVIIISGRFLTTLAEKTKKLRKRIEIEKAKQFQI